MNVMCNLKTARYWSYILKPRVGPNYVTEPFPEMVIDWSSKKKFDY